MPAQLRNKLHQFNPEVLREQLEGTSLGERLDASLHPHASFLRILEVLNYVMITYPMRPLTRDEVLSKNGYATDGMTGHLNKHTVVKDMVTERLFELQNVVEVALNHIENVYKAIALTQTQRARKNRKESNPEVKLNTFSRECCHSNAINVEQNMS